MFPTARWCLSSALAAAALAQAGCNMVPQQALQQSLLRSQQLARQNQTYSQSNQALTAQNSQLQQRNSLLQENLKVANQRLQNLASTQETMEQRYRNLLASTRGGPSPLSNGATQRFEDLAKQYPDFEFDPQTGVSKFHSDLLFASGSDAIKSDAAQLLKDFAAIMNREDAKHLNILVVGHTDDKPIVKKSTAARHPTNWHLSTNRANSVVQALKRFNVGEARMGSAGYSKFQPVVPNTGEEARRKNRRVEIFVLAPDAVVAGWDPGTIRN